MCNDNLSGPALMTFLIKKLQSFSPYYSYRLLFVPETIGSIAWLSLNYSRIKKIKFGLVLTCVGDKGNLTYKRTKHKNTELDKSIIKILEESNQKYSIIEFDAVDGSDERQFNSPGINIPMGSLTRTIYGRFPEYHTSADNLDFVNANCLDDTFDKYLDIIFILENNKIYKNFYPNGEPQLSKRGLYNLIGGQQMDKQTKAILWTLNCSDGKNSLLDIAIQSKMNFSEIKKATDVLLQHDMIELNSNSI